SVEIGNHAIGNAEIVRRINEFACPFICRFQMLVCGYRRLDGTHRSGADSAYPTFCVNCLVDDIGGLGRDDKLLGIHLMLGEVFHLYRPEGTQSHMERNLCKFDALELKALHQFSAEMQSGCRGRYSTFVLGKNGLIAELIFRGSFSLNVFGKRRLSKDFDIATKLLVSSVK